MPCYVNRLALDPTRFPGLGLGTHATRLPRMQRQPPPREERPRPEGVKAQRVDAATLRRFVDDLLLGDKPATEWDVAALLKLMWETWNDVFRTILGRAERKLRQRTARPSKQTGPIRTRSPEDDAYRASTPRTGC